MGSPFKLDVTSFRVNRIPPYDFRTIAIQLGRGRRGRGTFLADPVSAPKGVRSRKSSGVLSTWSDCPMRSCFLHASFPIQSATSSLAASSPNSEHPATLILDSIFETSENVTLSEEKSLLAQGQMLRCPHSRILRIGKTPMLIARRADLQHDDLY